MKIVLVGAGSAQFGCGTLGDIFCSEALAGSEITLHDINAQTLGAVLTTAEASVEKNGLPFTVNATTDRRAAFKGADFIISSIEVGNRFELWDEDWKVPLQYGARQVYGENGGPGGVFHALRIIPPILDIVKDAMDICPKAYIFNYSNPMTAICTTVKRAYPEARFIGMCHEIGWLSRWLPRMLGMEHDDIYFKAAGLNHFSCMLEVKDKRSGKDLYPTYGPRRPISSSARAATATCSTRTARPARWTSRSSSTRRIPPRRAATSGPTAASSNSCWRTTGSCL